jgi:hypothetical protein
MRRFIFLLIFPLVLASIVAREANTLGSAEDYYKSDIVGVDKHNLDCAIGDMRRATPPVRDTLTLNNFPTNAGTFKPSDGGSIDGLVIKLFGTRSTAMPAPIASPIELILDESGPGPNQAAAVDSLLFLRDPFPIVNITNSINQGTDKNTRVMIFVTNLQLSQGETSSSVVVNLIDSNNKSEDVAAEDVRPVPNLAFAQVIFRLPDTLAAGTCTVRVRAHGQVSNSRTVRIRETPTPFTVTIDMAKGLITFPNKYSGWQVSGGSATNFVAFPSGWTVGGGSATNFVALPPGWTVGGQPQTNFVAVPPGWVVGGQPQTNFIALPPGWTVGGQPQTNFVALPPGWTVGGQPQTNFLALPPGWTVGGQPQTNFLALPPGWTVGGQPQTNFVALAPGWTTGGQPQTNFVALPPGWTVGGQPQTNFVAVPPGWVVGGQPQTNFVTYPGTAVTSIQIAFNDPGFLALFQKLQAVGTYSDSDLADIIMAVYLNTQPFYLLRCGPFLGTNPRELAPAGQW